MPTKIPILSYLNPPELYLSNCKNNIWLFFFFSHYYLPIVMVRPYPSWLYFVYFLWSRWHDIIYVKSIWELRLRIFYCCKSLNSPIFLLLSWIKLGLVELVKGHFMDWARPAPLQLRLIFFYFLKKNCPTTTNHFIAASIKLKMISFFYR